MPHEKPWLDEDPIIKHKREIELQAKHDRDLMEALNKMMEARMANGCKRRICGDCNNRLCIEAEKGYLRLLNDEQKAEYYYYMSHDFEAERKPLTPEELYLKYHQGEESIYHRQSRKDKALNNSDNQSESIRQKGLFD